MTLREAYENTLIEYRKVKSASFYVEDFNYTFNKSISSKINELYAFYEKNQQLSDDLQNIYRHVIINMDSNVPFPFNMTYIDGSPFVRFNKTYMLNSNGTIGFNAHLVDGLNSINPTNNYRMFSDNTNIERINENIIFNAVNGWTGIYTNTVPPLDQIVVNDIEDGIILKIIGEVSIIDYRKGGNTNYLEYGFDLSENQEASDNGYIVSSSSNPVYLKYSSSTKMFHIMSELGYKIIDGANTLIHAPTNYLHILAMDNILSYKKTEACKTSFEKRLGVKRLTADTKNAIKTNVWLEPSLKKENNYYKQTNNINSVYPDFIIEYCSEKEKNLVSLTKVEFQYLREPIKYVLTDDDLDGVDNTPSLEWQDYMCNDFITKTIELMLESTNNPRLGSYKPVNDSNKFGRENN